ncbi:MULTISPECIES: carbohydrate ABC transporter permease [Microbacterium]|uniref:carbohydrate ABC transporter permease n=1 Tax=Microbacterium TaxID=33882 RepID=UPI001431397D|nr:MULTISPECIES: carbohydrate ABC transporter permease [Microbacterium]MCK6068125.1 carbohydrate ABC transporter permease [Microbacterium sp. EYE_512]
MKTRSRVGVYIVLTVAAAISALPNVLVLVGSLRPNSEIVANPTGLPTSLYLGNYARAWEQGAIGTYFLNSVVVTAVSLALALVLFLPAAYALGRWRFRFAGAIQALFLLGLMVPLKIGILPLAQMYDQWRLVDNLAGLVLVYTAQAAPLMVLILSTFYRQLPESLDDAARIDGASHFRTFFSVMTPLMKPAIAVSVVLSIGPIWNDFFMPLVLIRSEENFTIPVGVSSFFGEYTADRGMLYAAIVIAVAPVVIFFALAMRQIVSGLTAGIEK